MTTGEFLSSLLLLSLHWLSIAIRCNAVWNEAFLQRLRKHPPHSVSLCVFACAATGRVLADAHWFSDTIGGFCLSTAIVSATALVIKPVVVKLHEYEQEEEQQLSQKEIEQQD